MNIPKTFTPLQKRVVREWSKTKVVHPSYESIARKVGCSTQTAHKAVKKYLALKLDKDHGKK